MTTAAFFTPLPPADDDFSSIDLSFFHDDPAFLTFPPFSPAAVAIDDDADLFTRTWGAVSEEAADVPEVRAAAGSSPMSRKRCASELASPEHDVPSRKRCSSVSAATVDAQPPPPRRVWVKERSHDWWDQISHPDAPDADFKKAFRMSKATFHALCDALGSAVAKEDTMLRAAIPVKQRVAVCIWRLATGEPLRLVSKRFGLGISTCHKLVLEVCEAIKNVLMPQVSWPETEQEAAEISSKFEAMTGIPNIAGAMYTTHVPIIAPKFAISDYYNRRHSERNQKASYTVTIQGVVDGEGVFTDLCIGWPGSMSDDQVLQKSALYHQQQMGLAAGGRWVVGGAGYPLLDWLLVPYEQKKLTWTEHTFNEKAGEARRVAREAFSRLKARWGCLQKRTEVKLGELPVVLAACCVLHNICERSGDGVEPELQSYETVDDEVVPENAVRSAAAAQRRDAIAHDLLHGGRAGATFSRSR